MNIFLKRNYFIGECILETGLFIFNTEAHPVDGGSLECCRKQRLKEKENQDEDLNIFEHIDVDKLVDKMVVLSSPKEYLHISSNLTDSKTLREEYEELQVKALKENAENQQKLKVYCENKK